VFTVLIVILFLTLVFCNLLVVIYACRCAPVDFYVVDFGILRLVFVCFFCMFVSSVCLLYMFGFFLW